MPKTNMTPAAAIAGLSGDFTNMIVAMTPGGIEKQERDGQIETSVVPVLPKDGPWDKMALLGFIADGDYDDCFIKLKSMNGWRKKPTEHSMWTDLLDPQGRKRGSIFFKAAFYDRSAHFSLTCRYQVTIEPVGGWTDGGDNNVEHGCVKDTATNTIIFKTDSIDKKSYGDDRDSRLRYYEDRDKLRDLASNWLKENFPKYADCLEYW